MAITRRQFVTRLGALAAAVGMSQGEVSRIADAFGVVDPALGANLGKPKVIWIHGAECTGCSTSLLSILESGTGKPVYGDTVTTTADALGLAGVQLPTTLDAAGLNLDGGMVNIADVVVDVVDLQYHETVMGMGGDLAAQWLDDFITNTTGTPYPLDPAGPMPFVLVVEGALQNKLGGGAWGDDSAEAQDVPWCSIGMSDDNVIEHDMATTVRNLAVKGACLAVVPIGQCASYGGYPGCKPTLASDPEFDVTMSQTGAMGTYAYLTSDAGDTAAIAAAGKVVNVPGCPTNPFWFVLTVVALMADIQSILATGGPSVLNVLNADLTPNAGALDSLASRRLKAVYPVPVHSAWCPRYKYYTKGIYAAKPGQTGCLQKIGCKGLYTKSLCGVHGWNNHQPQNGTDGVTPTLRGGSHCTTAGHPCMGCTEPGYPDRFVPFVKL